MTEPKPKRPRKKRRPTDPKAYPKKNERACTQQEIAEVFGLTRMRINQIEKALMKKLEVKLAHLNPHRREER